MSTNQKTTQDSNENRSTIAVTDDLQPHHDKKKLSTASGVEKNLGGATGGRKKTQRNNRQRPLL